MNNTDLNTPITEIIDAFRAWLVLAAKCKYPPDRLNHNPITIALLMAPLSHNNVLHCFVLEIAFSIDQDQPRQQRASRATMDNEFMCI